MLVVLVHGHDRDRVRRVGRNLWPGRAFVASRAHTQNALISKGANEPAQCLVGPLATKAHVDHADVYAVVLER